MKKYRVKEAGTLGYTIQTKDGWFSDWKTVEEYKKYDKPRKVKNYGGFLGNIITEVTEEGGYSYCYFSTVEKAKAWIERDKAREKGWKKTRRRNKEKIVYEE